MINVQTALIKFQNHMRNAILCGRMCYCNGENGVSDEEIERKQLRTIVIEL